MISYDDLYPLIADTKLAPLGEVLPEIAAGYLNAKRHGKYDNWEGALNNLPTIDTPFIDLNTSSITAGGESLAPDTHQQLVTALKQLHPWRKGPFSIHGVDIDTEWRSDWKWDRLKDHIHPLTDRTVLDVGCGSGYHCWRMAGAGAKLVIGIDPMPIYVMQYFAMRHYIGHNNVFVLPLSMEQVPEKMEAFDTVFSMGVLYHRRSPIDHLTELKQCLRLDGELVLETLVIEGELGQVLMPEERYARMRNVWFIPSCETLSLWLRRCGFVDIRVVDVTTTTIEEQRRTEWMRFESLSDFLMPGNHNLTLEGYPAPKRAIITARRDK